MGFDPLVCIATVDQPAGPALLWYTLVAVVGLIVLVAHFKLHAFLALAFAALFIGIAAGLEPIAIATAFQDGVGAVLGSIAVVIGLGTILGKMLAESGGAQRVAETLTSWSGRRWLPWTMMVIALIIGTPVFFAVGLVLLAPIAYTLARQNGIPLLVLGIPLVAALSATHGLVPPHPGPIAAVGLLQADIGLTIFYSLVVAIPTAIIAGPLFGSVASRYAHSSTTGGLIEQLTEPRTRDCMPGFVVTLLTILLPVLLMVGASFIALGLEADSTLRQWIVFFGHPIVALLAAVLLSFFTFGRNCGFDRARVLEFTEQSLLPVASIVLVVGAGGGFSRVLMASGVDKAIQELAAQWALPPLVFGWLVAALIRVATGSATVAITTAAGLLAPVVAGSSEIRPELMVLAMGAGSLILSHVNDGGFWLVKEYLNLSVIDTLKTWTVLETIASLVAFSAVLLLDMIG